MSRQYPTWQMSIAVIRIRLLCRLVRPFCLHGVVGGFCCRFFSVSRSFAGPDLSSAWISAAGALCSPLVVWNVSSPAPPFRRSMDFRRLCRRVAYSRLCLVARMAADAGCMACCFAGLAWPSARVRCWGFCSRARSLARRFLLAANGLVSPSLLVTVRPGNYGTAC